MSKKYECDLNVVGIRKAEGGARSSIKSCQYTSHGTQTFAPIFWFTNADKRLYETIYDIKHSDCYEVYGLPRTGCVACPFATGNFENELEQLKTYEPKLYQAALNVFGKSYDYTRLYKQYRDEHRQQEKEVKNAI